MATSPALHHSLLRPTVLQILRATGYHATRASVLDTVTDLAARYMVLLAETTIKHAALNHTEPELSLEISIQDVRMAMQDCGLLLPEKTMEEQMFEGVEDTRGIDGFIEWAKGPANQEIRRIALEVTADGKAKEDYLTVLKKKHNAEKDSAYGEIIGFKPPKERNVIVEGSDIESIRDWEEKTRNPQKATSTNSSSRRQSSALSSLGDEDMEDMDAMDF